jgi:hypothetical protein
MALNTQTSYAALNAALNALAALANNGYIRIYDGAQPANADTALGAQVLLAELRFNATAFGAAASGVITANAITSDASANASGTATWFRALGSDGTTVLFDGTVGTATANAILNSVAISSGAQVSLSALTYTLPRAGA